MPPDLARDVLWASVKGKTMSVLSKSLIFKSSRSQTPKLWERAGESVAERGSGVDGGQAIVTTWSSHGIRGPCPVLPLASAAFLWEAVRGGGWWLPPGSLGCRGFASGTWNVVSLESDPGHMPSSSLAAVGAWLGGFQKDQLPEVDGEPGL